MPRHDYPEREPLRESSVTSPIRPGVGLALGGGFARGFAHLGVLQVLEQNQIPISHMAGTSVGSILGAAYASGAPLARIIATCRTLRFRDIARWHVTEAIFHEASLVTEPARTALLTAQCGGDTTLMAELRSLLAACDAEEDHRSRVSMESVSSGTLIGPYVID